MSAEPGDSERKQELLALAYAYVTEHGLVDVSLRPLAEAIGSSPRVLLFLFGSKDGLIQALLARARADELAMLADLRPSNDGLAETGRRVWQWLSALEHRSVSVLWAEGFTRSLIEPDGPWAGFAAATVRDWLAVFAEAQTPRRRRSAAGSHERTLLLAVLRGALLDLLATDDRQRTTAAVLTHLHAIA